MSDRGNRALLTLVALVLVIGGGGGLAFSLGALGSTSAHADIITSTVVHQWHRGGAISFAVASAIGLVLLLVGLSLAVSELSRDAGRSRLDDFTVAANPATTSSPTSMASGAGGDGGTGRDPSDRRGEGPGRRAPGFTLVRASSLAHALEADLGNIDGVQGALVRLLGEPGLLELRARLDVADDASLTSLTFLARGCLQRLETTSGLHPGAIDLTVSLVPSKRPRVS